MFQRDITTINKRHNSQLDNLLSNNYNTWKLNKMFKRIKGFQQKRFI